MTKFINKKIDFGYEDDDDDSYTNDKTINKFGKFFLNLMNLILKITQNSLLKSFKDIIPRMKNDITCEFEDLDDVIKRFNDEIIQNNGFDGRILAIESASYDANLEWEINTEQTLSILSTKNLFILRIFYETLNNDNQEKLLIQIGIEDFHPRQLTRSTFFRRPKFECFDQVIERGSLWLRQQTNQQRQRQFLNAQSLDVKMKSSMFASIRDLINQIINFLFVYFITSQSKKW